MNADESRFQYAVNVVLGHEGGLSDNANDSGGITKWGVSLRYLELEHMDINGDGIIDANDVRGLTKLEAIDIYRIHWWNQYRYNNINDLRLATKTIDLSVNMGSMRAHKLLQKAVNQLRSDCLVVDGILGPNTFAAINSFDAGKVINRYRLQAREFYMSLVADNEKYKAFLKGWLVRAAW